MKKIFTFGILMIFLVLSVVMVHGQATTTTTTTTTTIPPTAPTLNPIGDKDAFEDTELRFTITATDPNIPGDTLTLTRTGVGAISSGPTVSGTTVTWTYSFTPNDVGEDEVLFSLTDGTTTRTENITITTFPQLCEDGEVGTDLKIADLDLDEDEYFVGDDILLDVDVDNDGTKDLDINVEAFLYDVREEDKIEEFDSDTVEIQEDESENFEVELQFPFDNDLDEDGDFIIFVKAFEDGDEDTNCVQDSINVDLEREDNDIVIEEVRINPSIVSPGQLIEVAVDILNVGSDDQDDVQIEIVNTQLGISAKSNNFDIERAGDSDDQTERFTVRVPENAAAGDYSLIVRVLDEDGDAYDRGEEFVTLTVSGQAAATAELSLLQTSFEVNAGNSVTIPVTVRNTGSNAVTYVVDATPLGNWASPTSNIVEVAANSERNVDVILTSRSDATAGSNTVIIELKSGGQTLSSSNVVVNVKTTTGTEPITGGTVFRPRTSNTALSTIFWIIGDVALVIIIVYFIMLLVRRRK